MLGERLLAHEEVGVGSSVFVVLLARTMRIPVKKLGVSTQSLDRVSPDMIPGVVTIGSTAAHPYGLLARMIQSLI